MIKETFKRLKTGKQHSLRYDEHNVEFAKYLRLFYYNVKLSNITVSEIKKDFEIKKQ